MMEYCKIKTWKEKKAICDSHKARCSECEFQSKTGFTKGMCTARDKNGLTPNQMLYGNKF